MCYNIASILCVLATHEACGIVVSRPGMESAASALEGGILTTGQSGKSLKSVISVFC